MTRWTKPVAVVLAWTMGFGPATPAVFAYQTTLRPAATDGSGVERELRGDRGWAVGAGVPSQPVTPVPPDELERRKADARQQAEALPNTVQQAAYTLPPGRVPQSAIPLLEQALSQAVTEGRLRQFQVTPAADGSVQVEVSYVAPEPSAEVARLVVEAVAQALSADRGDAEAISKGTAGITELSAQAAINRQRRPLSERPDIAPFIEEARQFWRERAGDLAGLTLPAPATADDLIERLSHVELVRSDPQYGPAIFSSLADSRGLPRLGYQAGTIDRVRRTVLVSEDFADFLLPLIQADDSLQHSSLQSLAAYVGEEAFSTFVEGLLRSVVGDRASTPRERTQFLKLGLTRLLIAAASHDAYEAHAYPFSIERAHQGAQRIEQVVVGPSAFTPSHQSDSLLDDLLKFIFLQHAGLVPDIHAANLLIDWRPTEAISQQQDGRRFVSYQIRHDSVAPEDLRALIGQDVGAADRLTLVAVDGTPLAVLYEPGAPGSAARPIPLLNDARAFEEAWSEYLRVSVPVSERRIVEFHDVGRGDVHIAGGKGANLGEMIRRGEPVPPGSIVTAFAYRQFLTTNPQLKTAILELMKDLDATDSAQTEHASRKIEELILQTPISPELDRELRAAYRSLSERLGHPNHDLKVAMRSSSTKEDLATAAYAGQLETYLNIQGQDAVVETLPRDWASLYTKRVIEFRDVQILAQFAQEADQAALAEMSAALHQEPGFVQLAKFLGDVREDPKTKTSPQSSYARLRNWLRQHPDRYPGALETLEAIAAEFIDPEHVEIAVVMQEQIESQRSFVLFGVDPATGWTGRHFGGNARILSIAVNYGIGESIVQGLVTPDLFTVLASTDDAGSRRYRILRRTLGPKTIQTRYLERLFADVPTFSENDLRIVADAVKALAPLVEEARHRDAEARRAGGEGLNLFEEVRAAAEEAHTLSGLDAAYRARISESTSVQDRLADPATDLVRVAYELFRVAEIKELEELPTESELREQGIRVGLKEFATLARIARALNERRRTAETLIFDADLRDQFAATEQEILELARIADGSIEAYGDVRDMEGAMDRPVGDPDNRSFIVQSRPWASATDQDNPALYRDELTRIAVEQLVIEGRATRPRSDTEPLQGPGITLLLKGIPTGMAFSGRLVVLDETSGVPYEDQIEPGDIIFAEETTPQHFRAMQKSNGVITLRGSNLSHAAIESRGLGISTVVGVETYLRELRETDPAHYDAVMAALRTGTTVTVDGNNGFVYLDELPTARERIEVDISRANKNTLRRKVGFILANALTAARATKLAQINWLYAISLLRAEFSFGYIGIHPRAIIAYDMMRLLDAERDGTITDAERGALAHYREAESWASLEGDITVLQAHPNVVRQIQTRIKGFTPAGWTRPSAIRYFREMHYATIGQIAASFGKDQVKVYRFLDFKLRELKNLIGGDLFFETAERSSMIGYRGQTYLNAPENLAGFELEVEVLADLIEDGVQIDPMLAFVRNPAELQQSLEFVLAIFRRRGIMPRNLGMMSEIPANASQVQEFAQLLSTAAQQYGFQWYFSFGTNDLTQGILHAGRDEPALHSLNLGKTVSAYTAASRFVTKDADGNYILRVYDESRPGVIRAISTVSNASRQYHGKTGLCGEALNRLALSNPEGAAQIAALLDSGGTGVREFLNSAKVFYDAELRLGMVPSAVASRATILAEGTSTASQGAAARTLVLINTLEDLKIKRVYPGDIVVFRGSVSGVDLGDPEIRRAMRAASGVVTELDSPESEHAQLAAALKIPALLGVQRLFSQVADLETATVDFQRGKVYRGTLSLDETDPTQEGLLRVPEWTPDHELSRLEVRRTSAGPVYQALGIHPLVFFDADDGTLADAELAGRIAALRGGQPGAEAALERRLYDAYRSYAQRNGQVTTVIENDSLTSDDYRALAGGARYEDEEINPPLGLTQFLRVLRSRPDGRGFEDLLRLQLRVVNRLHREGHRVAFAINGLRVEEEMAEAARIIQSEVPDRGFPVGWKITTAPNNYLVIDELIRIAEAGLGRPLDFIFVDQQELAFAEQLADADNPLVRAAISEVQLQEAIYAPLRVIRDAAKRHQIAFAVDEHPLLLDRPLPAAPAPVPGSETIPDEAVRAWAQNQAEFLGASSIEVVDGSDWGHLIREAVQASQERHDGKFIDLGNGTYLARSHPLDTARTESRTYVATDDEADKGFIGQAGLNNWRRASGPDGLEQKMNSLQHGAAAGQKLYVIPYLMGPARSPLEQWLGGAYVTPSRYVALQNIIMSRLGQPAWEAIERSGTFVQGRHTTGNLETLNRGETGPEDDERHFVTFARERTIEHHGSEYGGNALFGKIPHGLRLASFDAHQNGWLVGQGGLFGFRDTQTGEVKYFAVFLPSGSGKTNLVMTQSSPDDRYQIETLGDDIVYFRREGDQVFAMNPENGIFGIAPGTNVKTNPSAMAAIGPGSDTIFTNVALNTQTNEVWWEDKTDEYPADLDHWEDWRGIPILDSRRVELAVRAMSQRAPAVQEILRTFATELVNTPQRAASDNTSQKPMSDRLRQRAVEQLSVLPDVTRAQAAAWVDAVRTQLLWAQPNSRFTTRLTNLPTVSPEWDNPQGVPISGIIFGGRVSSPREPLLRELRSVYEGIYDGAVMGVETTAAIEGGTQFRSDPMAMMGFFGPREDQYLEDWQQMFTGTDVRFFHVNWFGRGPDGQFLWPGYGENKRPLQLMVDRMEGRGDVVETPVGNYPTPASLHLEGLNIPPANVARLTTYDPAEWTAEMVRRTDFFAQFGDHLPDWMWRQHERAVAGVMAPQIFPLLMASPEGRRVETADEIAPLLQELFRADRRLLTAEAPVIAQQLSERWDELRAAAAQRQAADVGLLAYPRLGQTDRALINRITDRPEAREILAQVYLGLRERSEAVEALAALGIDPALAEAWVVQISQATAMVGSARGPAGPGAVAEVRPELRAVAPELFGDHTVNGHPLNTEAVIALLAEDPAIGQAIPKVLTARRELLESPAPVREKHGWVPWGQQFTDADGTTRTFRDIVLGQIQNFLGIESELAWRLNDDVPVPDDANPLKNPGLELTGPWNPLDMAMNQLNAGVPSIMPDEEDASPPWFRPSGVPADQPIGVMLGRRNMRQILAGEWGDGTAPRRYEVVKRGRDRVYTIGKARRDWPTMFPRLPGIHLRDPYVTVHGKPAPAITISAAIHLLNNYGSLVREESGVYQYIPKTQTPQEALIVEHLLRKLEDLAGLPHGSIKVAMLYEEGVQGRYLPAIAWVLRNRLVKWSDGRWDYLGSLLEMWKDEAVFPDPQTIGMASPSMMAYQRYSALMMLMMGMKHGELTNGGKVGGMAAVMIYQPDDPYGRSRYNPIALRAMTIDKRRERATHLIFVPEEPWEEGRTVTLEEILSGAVTGRLYDGLRQSWVASPDPAYVAAGNAELVAELTELQARFSAPEETVEVNGRRIPTVNSGLTTAERELFQRRGLINQEGKITPWVVTREMVDAPEKIFTQERWEAIYGVPQGDITIERIQNAFFQGAQYGFQILNGNYAAAVDDYEAIPGDSATGFRRFMNDLATYRIYVNQLWVLFHHGAAITQDGWLKAPKLTEDGVIPGENAVFLRAGTTMTPEVFQQLWDLHNQWTEAFFKEQDRLAEQDPTRAPRFDRSKAPIIMDILKRQILAPRFIQHSARVLFSVAEADDATREQYLRAIFAPTREAVVAEVAAGTLPAEALEVHDHVYDIFPPQERATVQDGGATGSTAYGRLGATDRRLINGIVESPQAREILAGFYLGLHAHEEAVEGLVALGIDADSAEAYVTQVARPTAVLDSARGRSPGDKSPVTREEVNGVIQSNILSLADLPYREQVKALGITAAAEEDALALQRGVLVPQFSHALNHVVSPAMAEHAVDVSDPTWIVVHSSVFSQAPDAPILYQRLREEVERVRGTSERAIRFALAVEGTESLADAEQRAAVLFPAVPGTASDLAALSKDSFDLIVPSVGDADALLGMLEASMPESRVGSVIGPAAWARELKKQAGDDERIAVVAFEPAPDATTVAAGSTALIAGVEAAVSGGQLDPAVAAKLTDLQQDGGVLAAMPLGFVDEEAEAVVREYRTRQATLRATSASQ